MTVKDLIANLRLYDDKATVLIASDEELNMIRSNMQVAKLSDRKNTVIIYGLDGSEVDL
jgi:hypothetical protein